jgi:hypothetical protein
MYQQILLELLNTYFNKNLLNDSKIDVYGQAESRWKAWQSSLAHFKKVCYKCIKNHFGDLSTTPETKKVKSIY